MSFSAVTRGFALDDVLRWHASIIVMQREARCVTRAARLAIIIAVEWKEGRRESQSVKDFVHNSRNIREPLLALQHSGLAEVDVARNGPIILVLVARSTIGKRR
jgi:hypothetical protein